MRIIQPNVVGGPLLGTATSAAFWKNRCTTMAPVVVTTVSGGESSYVLLPSAESCVSVLSYRTGVRLGTLDVTASGKVDDDVNDESSLMMTPVRIGSVVAVGVHPQQQQPQQRSNGCVWVGCSNGCIAEFAVDDLQTLQKNSSDVLLPRTLYKLASEKHSITHMAVVAPSLSSSHKSTTTPFVLYALLSKTTAEKRKTIHSASLVRVVFPPGQVDTSAKEMDGTPNTINISDKVVWMETFKFSPDTDDTNFIPFSLQAVQAPLKSRRYGERHDASNGQGDDEGILCVLASAFTLTIYSDDPLRQPMGGGAENNHIFKKVQLDTNTVLNEPVTYCQVLAGSDDIACGQWSGAIRILHNVLSTTRDYCLSQKYKKPKRLLKKQHRHPVSSHLLIRKVHWHAHAVRSMTYDPSSGTLYTGGDESVLVSWQLQRGIDKPSHVLPRISVGSIQHVVFINHNSNHHHRRSDADAVLVACSDNSLHLLEAHSKQLLWKVQGLAAVGPAVMLPNHVPTIVSTTTRDNDDTIMVSGLASAAGSIHWYSVNQQAVSQQLHVVPFNRVSRTEREKGGGGAQHTSPPVMPAPVVTHVVSGGNDLVTVDVVPTENRSVGAFLAESQCGSVTCLRFWTRTVASSSSSPYEPTAAMTYPHGSRNRVSAVALSKHGKYAVTVSNDEKAFRLWCREDRPDETMMRMDRSRSSSKIQKHATNTPPTVHSPSEWVCRCKVSVPSGYSNFGTGAAAVAFSSDASVLAVAFGPFVTLWDHHEVTLLTALRHSTAAAAADNDEFVDSVQFLHSDRLTDGMMLIQSKTCVSLRSPYGDRGPTGVGWNWILPADEIKKKTRRVSCVEFLPSEELVVIVQYNDEKDESRVLLIDAISGNLCQTLRGGTLPVIEHIKGDIVSLTATNRCTTRNGWAAAADPNNSAIVCLYGLTTKGELICLSNQEKSSALQKALLVDSDLEVPTLALLASLTSKPAKKRKQSVIEVGDLEEVPTRSLSVGQFGSIVGEERGPIHTPQLPLLRGAFFRAFVGRHLQRGDAGQ